MRLLFLCLILVACQRSNKDYDVDEDVFGDEELKMRSYLEDIRF
jgi:hypothetical protein